MDETDRPLRIQGLLFGPSPALQKTLVISNTLATTQSTLKQFFCIVI